MVAGDLITMDYQYEYNGLLLGCETDFDAEELTSLMGYAALRSSTDSGFGRHGGVPGRMYANSRDFALTFHINGQASGMSNDVAYKELRRQVGSAFRVRTLPTDEIPFIYQHPAEVKRFLDCRPTALDMPVNRQYALKYPTINVRFEATDPRHYDLESNVAQVALPVPGGGLDFPLDFPLNFGVTGGGGTYLVANHGDAPAHWMAEIPGPVVDPMIEYTNDTTGIVSFVQIQGLTLLAGDTLVFNSKKRTVTLGGQSRRSFMSPQSTWFMLPEAPEVGTIRFKSADAAPTTSILTFTWHHAYWGH